MCILLPFSLVGGIISNKIIKQEQEGQRGYELSILRELAKEINDVVEQAQQFQTDCQGNGSIIRILNGNAKGQDYRALASMFEEGLEQNEYWFAVGIGDGERVLFQRGEKYLSEAVNQTHVSRLDEEMEFWTGADEAEYWDYAKLRKEPVISLYSNLYNMFRYSRLGEIFICISEEKLRERYLSYLPEDCKEAFIINETGEIISSRWREDLGKDSGYLEKIRAQKNQNAGYLDISYQNQSACLYYVKCDNGWYLASIMEVQGVHSEIIFTMVAVGVCLIFGLTYACIQNRYIIAPLRELSDRMNQVKWGKMEEVSLPANQDEIGSIIRNFEDMMRQINHLVNQVYLEKIKTQEAEREGLLAQMKPHFLYNTLDSIHWAAIRNRDYEVGRQLEALSEIFKHVLNFGKGTLSIEDELELAESYFYLVKIRNSTPIDLKIRVEEKLKKQQVPKLIIQPLVENAIVHGLEEKEDGGRIWIRVRERKKEGKPVLEILVADNGVGTDQEKVRLAIHSSDDPSKAFALRNIDERVRLIFGETYGLKFYSKKGMGTVVKVYLGCEEDGVCD